MLYIRTGLMGHGKTLNTIKEVDLAAKKDGRAVYYHNVTDLDASKLQAEWFPFDDPLKWYELPDNALIVVDEAQGWFGVRDPRKEVPEHISRFEIMRKQGHEVHLITQDPRFIDVHARRLCNKHIHYWRIFGSGKVSRYEMERVYNDVEKVNTCKDASRTIISLDKRYFGVYTSAKAEHHFSFKPSRKFVLATLGLGICIYASLRGYSFIYGAKETETPATEAALTQSAPKAESGNLATDLAKSLIPGIAKETSAPMSRGQYLAERIPRVENVPSSAPLYDDLTKPQSFPRLYCMSSTDPNIYARNFTRMAIATVNGKQTVCQCYTQQGTRVETDFSFCMRVVEVGYFDPTRPDRSQQAFGQLQQPQSIPGFSQPHMQPPADSQATPPINVVSYEKGRFLW